MIPAAAVTTVCGQSELRTGEDRTDPDSVLVNASLRYGESAHDQSLS